MTDDRETDAVESDDDTSVEADDGAAESAAVPPDYLDPKPLDPTGR